MDLVSLGMEVLLVTLLFAALAYGVKLERKLKALRDSQAGFAEAVRQLDGAAARAEAGLETLRLTTDEAHDGLHDRILKARELRHQLEALVERAERAGQSLAAAPPVLAKPAPGSSTPAPATRPRPPRSDPALPGDRDSPAFERLHERGPAVARPALKTSPRAPVRGLDEELFASEPAPRRVGRSDR